MLSLIIPTYNRPHFLKRLLRYFQQQEFPYRIAVADSSSAPACDANLSIVASLKDDQSIHYEKYPPEINPFLKIAQALSGVDSKYAVICADDDFLVPKAIELCVHFLESNPDYSIAHGHAARLEHKSIENHGGHHDLRIHTYPQCDIGQNDPRVRLQKHLEDYSPTFYSVHRRSDLMRNMQLSYDNSSDCRFGEVLPSCLSLIQGRAKRLNILYMVRQITHDSTTTSMARPSWPSLFTSDNFSRVYVKFRDCLAEELMSTKDLSMMETKDIVNHAFLSFMAQMLYINNIGQFAWRPRDVFNQAARHIGQGIKMLPAAARFAVFGRQFVDVVRSPHEVFRKLRCEQKLPLMKPGSRFRTDFMPIYKHVMHYPNGCDTYDRK